MTADVARSFDPIASADARVLVLGSMPGRASLEAQQYYAYPHNAFWSIMATLLEFDAGLPYARRTAQLAAHGVALWDVLQSCERAGSLDSSIVEATIVPNDFASFYDAHPDVRHVFFNGARAEAAYRKHVAPDLASGSRDIKTVRLPSTSPAHASLRFEQKLDKWRVVSDALTP